MSPRANTEQQLPDPVVEAGPDDEVIEELVVEEISIDGMCGVY